VGSKEIMENVQKEKSEAYHIINPEVLIMNDITDPIIKHLPSIVPNSFILLENEV
jgi:hypothetical protein